MPDQPRKSAAITNGPHRAPARAMLHAAGFSREDLKKPIIGIANTWIEIGPGNYHLRELAEHIKKGVRDAGGTPMEFNTVSISDGITMGSQGMKASLVSREVIADSIELVARGKLFEQNVTIQDVFEAVGAHARGAMSDAELQMLEESACPGAGACGGQFTANTMSMVGEFLGISPMGANAVPAMVEAKNKVAYEAGRLVMELFKADVRPSQIITRDAIENAIASVAASGGSTNAVLHLLAIAHEMGIELSIDDFDRINRRVPLLCDLKPGGRFVATDLYVAGGTRLVAQRLLEAGLLHANAKTVTQRTIEEEATSATETPGQEVVRPISKPLK